MTEITKAEPFEPDSAELRERILKLVNTVGECNYELGQRLYDVDQFQKYKEWGFGSFKEYISEEIGWSDSKTGYVMRAWKKFGMELGMDWADFRDVDWTKLGELAGVVLDPEDAERWLGMARKHSRRELVQLIRQAKIDRGEKVRGKVKPSEVIPHDVDKEIEDVHETTDRPFVDPTTLNHPQLPTVEGGLVFDEPEKDIKEALHSIGPFWVYPEQYQNIMAAFERMGQLANSDKPGYLLDCMCAEINTNHADEGDGTVAHSLEFYIRHLERIFEVKIEVGEATGPALAKMTRTA